MISTSRRAVLAGAVAGALGGCLAAPLSARAQVAVFDPSNYAQNVLIAARTLETINHQITALQNQAQALVNQARNLTTLPLSELSALRGQIQRTQTLLAQAQQLAFKVEAIDEAFKGAFGPSNLSSSDATLVANAQTRWTTSVAAFQDALKIQAGVVGNLDGARDQMSRLVDASQSATGALQAAQAGNQLLALQSQQLGDLTALLAAQGRADNLDAATRAAAQDQAREQLRRFLTPGAGYQPRDIQLFKP